MLNMWTAVYVPRYCSSPKHIETAGEVQLHFCSLLQLINWFKAEQVRRCEGKTGELKRTHHFRIGSGL